MANPSSFVDAASVKSTNTFSADQSFTADVSMTGALTLAPAAAASGARTGLTLTGAADTGVTASTEQTDLYVNLARTVTWATGALTTQRAVRIAAPTYAFAGASTMTNAATLYIDAAPTAGTNATITNAYALWVDAGATRLDGAVTCGSTLGITGTTTFTGAALFNGAITADAGDESGTPGNATINKAVGKAAIAIGAASVTITNSLVTASSIVLVTAIDQDGTAVNLSAAPGAGSFVVTAAGTATAATKFSFLVIN